ncbi:MAG TPA: ABC transporter permease [Acidimicrobiales bacterium]|nr:ABC transporter permease [Acidimicrobiales bacterium]
MATVWFVARSELRQRWRSWLTLSLLVAVVGGVVLGATAAGRRTASAFPDFARVYGVDSFVYAAQPLPKLGRLPEVASAVQIGTPANGTPTCACSHPLTSSEFSVFEVAPAALPRFAKLVSGRMPDQSKVGEVLASFSLEQDFGMHVGTVVHIPFYTAAQAGGADTADGGAPQGPTVAVRVVGIAADEEDFPSVGTPAYEVFSTTAFDREVNPQSFLFTAYAVRLRHGSADLPRFDRDATAVGAFGNGGQEATSSITAAIHPQAMGWWLLALLAGIAGAATVAQALSRQAMVEDDAYRTLAALGLGPGGLFALGMGRALVIGGAGAVGALAIAFALSPVAPVGEARVAELSTGFAFDGFVLLLGALAVVAAVAVLGAWPAFRSSRGRLGAVAEDRAHRASRVVGWLASTGAPPSTVVGVRRALERGHGRNAVPVGTALVGTVLAVSALCCTTVFGASLGHLTSTPRLFGQPFRIWFNNLGTGPSGVQPVLSQLKADSRVTDITLGTSGSVEVNGVATDAIAGQSVRGPMLVSSVTGRVPGAADEVALGTRTMRLAGAHVGSVVRVSVPLLTGGTAASSFRVVGSASFPPDFGVVGLNTGAIFTVAGYVDAQCPPGPTVQHCRAATADGLNYVLLAGTKPGAAARAATTHYLRAFPDSAVAPVTPANLVNFGRAVDFPLILGGILLVFGAATLVHMLVVCVARRRRELGLLKALGFLRHQAAAAVCWQSTTIALVGVVLGVPIGLAAGHVAWVAFATNIGVVPFLVSPLWVIAVLALGVVVAANVLAIGPAVASARQSAGPALRGE